MNETTKQQEAKTVSGSRHDRLVILHELGLTNEAFDGYDKHDQVWMIKTSKHPPTAYQLSIAFGKYASGTRPGDDMWCEYDKDALDYCLLTYDERLNSGAAKPSRCNVELEVHITKKPTRRDLLCVITELQALIGEARATHGNDRNPHGYEQGQRLLKRAEDLCIQARGFDSPTDMPSND